MRTAGGRIMRRILGEKRVPVAHEDDFEFDGLCTLSDESWRSRPSPFQTRFSMPQMNRRRQTWQP